MPKPMRAPPEGPGHLSVEDRAALTSLVSAEADRHDREGSFPTAALAAVAAQGLVGHPPLGSADAGPLLRILAAVGRGDLSVGRIYEGHVNALLLMRMYGTPAQRAKYDSLAGRGEIFGIWNTDLPDNPLVLNDGKLGGRKTFATGVDGLGHAIVTVPHEDGRTMLVVPLAGLPVDRTWWQPLGMKASGSHIVDFTGIEIEPEHVLGLPGDYLREPWFSAGAMRFAAVHAGGAHAVFEAALAHLRKTRRTDDPYQTHRIGRMGMAIQSSYSWLDQAAEAWSAAALDESLSDRAIAVANAARMAIEGHAMAVLEEAERSVGAAGFVAPHPLERLIRDLRTYLRQPNPDGALARVGSAIAEGEWTPG